MPVAPWQETQLRVVIEFKKSNKGVSRHIELTHRPDVLPPQLQGRVHPEVWRAFMVDIQALSARHPYTAAPTAGQCCYNLGGCLCFICVGFGMFEPDGGSYAVWYQEVASCLARHQPAFAQGGCRLTLQEVHGSHFIQVDIDPNVAVGAPVAGFPPMAQPGGPYDPAKPAPGFAGAPPPGAAYPPGYGAPPPDAYAGQGYPPQQPAPHPPPAGAPAQYPPMK